MNRLNKKGFALVETLIVSVFVISLFTFFYANMFPLIGEYERYENYDDISTKYMAHYFRMMILQDENHSSITNLNGAIYKDLTDCSLFKDQTYCNTLKNKYSLTRVYLTAFNLEEFKNLVNTTESLGNEFTYANFSSYIEYLPTYKDLALEKTNYNRIIIETSDGHYSTIEVRK